MSDNAKYHRVVGREPHPVWIILSTVALLAIAAGTIMPIFDGMAGAYVEHSRLFAWIYAAGALSLLISRLFSPYTGQVVRVKRLYRIETWAAVIFCVAAFFLFYDQWHSRDWLAFTLAGGALQVFTSIMIPHSIKKELKTPA